MDSLIKNIYAAFSTSPLTVAQKDLYIDFNAVRGGANVVKTLARRIRLQGGATCQVLAGHDGSGKSTELYRLQGELESGDRNSSSCSAKPIKISTATMSISRKY